MVDVFSKRKRSEIMAGIRGKGNAATELRLRELFRQNQVNGWRRHYRLPGTPDFAFPDSRLAIFVDGCFWHGCRKCQRIPKSNVGYWLAKFAQNRSRDRRVDRELRKAGWIVLRLRQCTLKDRPDTIMKAIASRLAAKR
jgi:DNA mismatch endonuclease, patch repair protein